MGQAAEQVLPEAEEAGQPLASEVVEQCLLQPFPEIGVSFEGGRDFRGHRGKAGEVGNGFVADQKGVDQLTRRKGA